MKEDCLINLQFQKKKIKGGKHVFTIIVYIGFDGLVIFATIFGNYHYFHFSGVFFLRRKPPVSCELCLRFLFFYKLLMCSALENINNNPV